MFRYYSHILRANSGDKSKEIGLRKFYAQDNYERLKSKSIMDDILELAYFWREVNTSIPHEQEEKRTYTISDQARKYLGGVLKSMLTLNEAIIDVKEG